MRLRSNDKGCLSLGTWRRMTELSCSILPSRRTAELGLRVELWPYLANGADVFVSLYWVIPQMR